MVRADFIIEHAVLIATCAGPAPRRGSAQRDISPFRNAVIASRNGTIVHVGPESSRSGIDLDAGGVSLDAAGCTVVPGFVDPHTHAVYAGNRHDELRERGILQTVTATRAATGDELLESARTRLDAMLACGTTTCEIKSGYGLTTDSELLQLRVIRQLNDEHPIDVVPTFLGAHEVPEEYWIRPDDYVALVINEMIPRVAAEQLAVWCDVFCEEGAFALQESVDILTAGARAGLKPRIHANELAASGGTHVAVKVKARSADHLIFVGEAEAAALADAGICAVLLPAAALSLKAGRFAPARMLIDRGVPVALGTDLNPGAGLSPSMPFAMTLACFEMQMTLEEALIATTLNAAWSLDRSDSVGSLERGKVMDAVVIDGDLADLLRVGPSPIRAVVKRGQVVYE